jgi:hypothetical protein
VDDVVVGGLIGIGGVVLGVLLTAAVDAHTRSKVAAEQLENARRARELVAAEKLDGVLVEASAALDRGAGYAKVKGAWEVGWVAYSSRLRTPELLDRYRVIGGILNEVVQGDRSVAQVTKRIVARAIANARATLAYFMRGDDELPPECFPNTVELIRLLGAGDGLTDPMGPLKDWLASHPEPIFHPEDLAGLANRVQTAATPPSLEPSRGTDGT